MTDHSPSTIAAKPIDWDPPAAWEHGAIVLIERIMTQHWDMVACRCWVCVEGRQLGCRPRRIYLVGHGLRSHVTVPWPIEKPVAAVPPLAGANESRYRRDRTVQVSCTVDGPHGAHDMPLGRCPGQR